MDSKPEGEGGAAGGTAAGVAAAGAAVPSTCDPVTETGVLLDAVIHDLRTPLSAMSGWLEVLEAHFGTVDGIVGRALLGLRRGVEGQTQTLNGLSDVLTKQRIEFPEQDDCQLLEQLQLALAAMDRRGGSPLDAAASARLEPFRTFTGKVAGKGALTCPGGGSTLRDACTTLLHAVALAQAEGDAPIAIDADADVIRITVPGAGGDRSSLESLSRGLRFPATKRPPIQPQTLWLARTVFRRCKVGLRVETATGGGLELLIEREAPDSTGRAAGT